MTVHARARRTARAGAAVCAAALLLVLGACGSDGGSDAEGDGGTGADSSPTSQATEQSATQLRLAEAAGRCMAPNVRVLRNQDVAFEGTVSEIAGGEVTLEVTHWFKGEETDLAVVRAPAEGMVDLGYGTEFVEGEDYLVSATSGDVTLCGFTGPVSNRLEALYAKAYER